ncbi:hypothetical protein, partial [Parabacteroides johnsonii]|uniref:hypothetical protein n=1 Tax=Parabacteroides johnsonii TaxID=387661 RepID=UPI00242DD3EA
RGLVHKKRCANFDTPPFLHATFFSTFTFYLYTIYFKQSLGEDTILFHLHPGISVSPRFSLPPIHTDRKAQGEGKLQG